MSELNIWNRLLSEIGNPYGAAGVMGNVARESGLKSNNLQNSANKRLCMTDKEYTESVDAGIYINFIDDRAGYGLCQWTSSGRKASLLYRAKSQGVSISDENMQLDHLIYELNSSYKKVLDVLKTAKSVKEASDIFMVKYEAPDNKSEANKQSRANTAQEYYNKYAGAPVNVLNGRGLADFAISKIGMPYFYGAKISHGPLTESYMALMHKNYPNRVTDRYMAKARAKKQVGVVNVDCSGLIAGYRGKNVGSAQLRSTATKKIAISQIATFPVGTVLWKNGHVGVYIGIENGIPMCVEAKGIDYGVVKTKVSSTKWVYGLLFSDMVYDFIESNVSKAVNPYKEPTKVVCSKSTAKTKKYKETQYYSSGEPAKWLQWELKQAGYNLGTTGPNKDGIDGNIGPKCDKALAAFQQSSKLTVDKLCGPTTRRYLKMDDVA